MAKDTSISHPKQKAFIKLLKKKIKKKFTNKLIDGAITAPNLAKACDIDTVVLRMTVG